MSALGRILARALAIAVSLVLVVPAVATAADDPTTPTSRLGLSMDENGPWTTSLGTPLFDPDFRWVPGDRIVSGFWATNLSTDSAEFRISLLPRVTALLDSGEFQIEVRADDDRWQPIRTAWSAPRPLAAGEKMHIQIRAELPESASNATQTLAFGFDLRTRLTYQGPVATPTPRPTPAAPESGDDDVSRDGEGAAAKDADAETPASPNHGSLAGTGADQPAWLPPLGFGALITGLWLALAARRRSDEESDAA